MAIRIVTGNMGSGKTYYAVNFIAKNYCIYDKKNKTYHLDISKYILISNIDNLSIKHMSLDDILETSTIDSFFSKDNQDLFVKQFPGKSIVYFIDEAQRFFHKKYYNNEVFFFFEYHRHLGIDIFLICPSIKSIAPRLIELQEHEIHALSRTKQVLSKKHYQILSGQEIIDRKFLSPDRQIYELYKSMDSDESIKKHKNPIFKYLFMFMLVFICIGTYFYRTLFAKAETSKTQLNQHVIAQKKPDITTQSTIQSTTQSTSADVSENKVRLDYVKSSKSLYFIDPLIPGRVFKYEESPYPILTYNDNIYYAIIPAK